MGRVVAALALAASSLALAAPARAAVFEMDVTGWIRASQMWPALDVTGHFTWSDTLFRPQPSGTGSDGSRQWRHTGDFGTVTHVTRGLGTNPVVAKVTQIVVDDPGPSSGRTAFVSFGISLPTDFGPSGSLSFRTSDVSFIDGFGGVPGKERLLSFERVQMVLGPGLVNDLRIDPPVTPPNEPTPALPEPGTWAMMILGLGAIGVAVRRRRMLPA